MEPLTELSRATSGFQHRLEAVMADQWSMPSACDELTVRDLADHLIGGPSGTVSPDAPLVERLLDLTGRHR